VSVSDCWASIVAASAAGQVSVGCYTQVDTEKTTSVGAKVKDISHIVSPNLSIR